MSRPLKWLGGIVALGGLLYALGRADLVPLPSWLKPSAARKAASDGRTADGIEARRILLAASGEVDVEGGTVRLTTPIPGLVKEVRVVEGQTVAAGAPLLFLHDLQAQARVKLARARLQEANLRLADARREPARRQLKINESERTIAGLQARLRGQERELDEEAQVERRLDVRLRSRASLAFLKDRIEDLKSQLAVEEIRKRREEMEDAEEKIAQAQAALTSAQAELESAEAVLDQHILRAPAPGGTVQRVMTAPGQFLGSDNSPQSQQGIWFSLRQEFIVRCEVEQMFMHQLKANLPAVVFDDDNREHRWEGSVRRVSNWVAPRRIVSDDPQESKGPRTRECVISIQQKQPAPLIGQRVRVLILSPEEKGTAGR